MRQKEVMRTPSNEFHCSMFQTRKRPDQMEKSSIHVYRIPKISIYLFTFILREMNSRKCACKLICLTYIVSSAQTIIKLQFRWREYALRSGQVVRKRVFSPAVDSRRWRDKRFISIIGKVVVEFIELHDLRCDRRAVIYEKASPIIRYVVLE